MDGPVRRPLVVLVAMVMAFAFFAGCSDSAKDEKLRDGAIGIAEPDTFSVPKGTKKLVFHLSTKTDTGVDCTKPDSMYSLPCVEAWDDDEPDEDEKITFKAFPAAEAQRADDTDADYIPPVFVTMSRGQTSSKTIHDPTPGTWVIGTEDSGSDPYEGPAYATAAIPGATTGGDGLLNLGPLWDILGLVVAIAGFAGAWIIYRRRAKFMSNQLHRIDDTFTRFSDDLSECRTNLIELKKELNVMLFKRKLEEPQYLILEKRIEQYLKDLETPGNRHGPTVAPEFVTVFESEEDIIGPGSALERLRQRRTADD